MSKSLRTSYSIERQVESFFTGSQLQFEQDGEHFFCAHGSIINKVSVQDGQVKAQITANNEDDTITRFTLTTDDELLIIAYNSGLIMKYNLKQQSVEREFKSIHNAPIAFLKTNPSNSLLATGSSDGTVKLWNLKNHYCSHNMKGINGVVSCIEFFESQEADLLFCAGGDDNIYIFDINTSKKIAKLSTHCSTITDMKITPDGSQLISVGRDKIAVIWNINRSDEKKFGKTIKTIPVYESVESIVLIDHNIMEKLINNSITKNDDRTYFATIGEEGVIKFWDSKSGSKLFSQNDPSLSDDRCPNKQSFLLCSRPNYQQLCAVSYERDIFIYDLPQLNLIQQLQGHIDEILSVCWFANDNYLAIACNSNDLKIMEVNTSKTQHLKGHTDIVLCVKALTCDPFCVITSSKDCTVLVWKFEPETMHSTVLFKGTGHTHAIFSLAVVTDERIFFSGSEDTTLKRWSFIDTKDENRIGSLNSNHESLDVDLLIAKNTVKAHNDRIDDIAVSPNDQLVATGSRDKTAKIFSASNLQLIATLKGHRRGINALRFSPVDQVIITAGDLTLKMWNLQDFSCIKTFQGHECTVLNFTFLNSGLQILSVGSDGNMKVWNCKTNECMKTIDAHSGNTWSLCPTEDETMVVTGGQDEKLIIWRDTTKEEQEKRLVNLQTQVVQEQDFANYIDKKKWRKALKMAISMENQTKTLNVIREILLEPDCTLELEEILMKIRLDQLNFLIECCVSWTATAKNGSIAQLVFNIIARNLDKDDLLKMPSLRSTINHFRLLTEKTFGRYERLVQQAYFVDFFLKSFRIQ